MGINTMTFAARDFWRRQGASAEHIRSDLESASIPTVTV
jgi:hypothetical protein